MGLPEYLSKSVQSVYSAHVFFVVEGKGAESDGVAGVVWEFGKCLEFSFLMFLWDLTTFPQEKTLLQEKN